MNFSHLSKDVDTGSEFVRRDVAVAIILTILAGIGVAIVTWNALAFIPFVIIGYVFVGLSTVYEWNKKLQAEGMVERQVFSNITTAVAFPALLLMAYLALTGHAVWIAGPAGVGFVLAYEFLVYLIGFRGVDTDEVHFEFDPFDNESRVYTEDVYIPRLEEWAVQQAKKNRGSEDE